MAEEAETVEGGEAARDREVETEIETDRALAREAEIETEEEETETEIEEGVIEMIGEEEEMTGGDMTEKERRGEK